MSDAVVLNNKIIKDTHFCFLQFREYLPFQKDITLCLNNLESSYH